MFNLAYISQKWAAKIDLTKNMKNWPPPLENIYFGEDSQRLAECQERDIPFHLWYFNKMGEHECNQYAGVYIF